MINIIKRIVVASTMLLTLSLAFGGAPGWSVNAPDYEFTGSVTAQVHLNGELAGQASTDLIAAFYGDEIRGTTYGNFFPPAGVYVFNLMMYSNQSTGETLTFKYYDSATDQVVDIEETLEFVNNMTLGNGFTPQVFSATTSEPEACDANHNEWIINAPDYEFTGSMTIQAYINGSLAGQSSDSYIAAFVDDEIRGTTYGNFFPPAGVYVFNLMTYSNQSSGETLTFKYWDAANGHVCLNETQEFINNMTLGNGFAPIVMTGESSGPSEVFGCTDAGACNYDESATSDDGSCEYPADDCTACDGSDLGGQDCAGECGGSAELDDCGVCDGGNADMDECGECFGIGYTDNCGTCDDDPSNDCTQDCAGVWGGSSALDDCGVCDGDNADMDDCGVCFGGNADDLGCGCFEDAALTYYADTDGDGFGAGDGTDYCLADVPEGYVTNNDDAEPDCATNDTDDCGVCAGDNSSCTGCMDPTATNFDPFATINDPSQCSYGTFTFNQSMEQAFYFFENVTIDGIDADYGDFIWAFRDTDLDGVGDIPVGGSEWQGPNFEITVMGDDPTSYTDGYLNPGEVPVWKIYDASEDALYDAVMDNQQGAFNAVPGFAQFGAYFVGTLSAIRDCATDLGGHAYLDDCDVCSAGSTGHLENSDDVGCGCFAPDEILYWDDVDGDLVGYGTPELYCSEMGDISTYNTIFEQYPDGWVVTEGLDDNCPVDANGDQIDYDNDSETTEDCDNNDSCGGDVCDLDDDNDLILDDADDCSQGDLYWTSDSDTDHDTDGCQDLVEDGDDDNDGQADADDDCDPDSYGFAGGDLGWTSDADTDHDDDGCQDDSLEDLDDDNDGVLDEVDDCHFGVINWDEVAEPECGLIDCAGQCADGYESWIGDGYCDDGTWGLYFNCDEFGNDAGDCDVEEPAGCEFLDCVGQEACGYESWVGDGWCDDGAYGLYFNCDEFNCDAGDCDCGGGEAEGCIDCVGTDCTGYESWQGDGYCDDGTYGIDFLCEEFNFDDGDCDSRSEDHHDGEMTKSLKIRMSKLQSLTASRDTGLDYDNDGCLDSDIEDLDDDNDGLGDGLDVCDPDSGLESDLGWTSDADTDHDTDGCQDSLEDGDDDNDGILDDADSCHFGDLGWTSDGDTDYDGDGCQDDSLEDLDDDNDGVLDGIDTDSLNEFVCADDDEDGCEDCSSGYYDVANDGPDNDADGQCDLGDVDINLVAGANLTSFFALPDDLSVENIFGDLGANVTKVINEGQAAINTDNGFVGSLDEIEADHGYWVITDDADVLQVQGLPTSPVLYGLHTGNNLISYSYHISQSVEDALPDAAESNLEAIYGAGVSTVNINGSWVGSLNALEGGSGYWFIASSPLTFEYNAPDGSGLGRLANALPALPEEFRYNQSMNQFFYFVSEATVADMDIEEGDIIVAYNGDVVVGAREWQGGMADVPVMGYDNQTETTQTLTAGYMEAGNIPVFRVLDASTGELKDMNMVVESGSAEFQNIGHAVIILASIEFPSEVALHNAYPNPFNPSTTIKYDVPADMHVNMAVYDVRGRLVSELVNEFKTKNVDSYSVVWNADAVSSGVYFLKLAAGNTVHTQKIMLIK